MIGPLAYVGGKRRVAAVIAASFPPHVTYVEPFAGGAQVFFHKPKSRVEVLNDLDGEILNFLRVCQHHPHELVRHLRYLVPSRVRFAAEASQSPDTLTDIQRAARLFYLQKNAFGGRICRRTYHYCVSHPANFNLRRIPAQIAATAERLQNVQLESWPYERVLERYDRPTTLFYCDPPYVGLQLYRFNFAEADYHTLAQRLTRLQGKFVLSLNDCALTRHVFGHFHISPLPVAYTANRLVPHTQELLIRNY